MKNVNGINAAFPDNTLKNRVGEVFSSLSAAIIFLIFGAACWFFNAPALCTGAVAAEIVITLLTAKNVKNIFAVLLFVPFFIPSTPSQNAVWSAYAISIVAAAVAVPCFALSKLIVDGNKTKGKLYIPAVFFTVAALIGGVFGRFNIIAFAVTLGVCAEMFALYFIALNYTENLADFFALIFIFGAALVLTEIFVFYSDGEFLSGKKMISEPFFSAESLNSAALIFTLAIGGCLHFGLYRKKYVLCAAASFLFLAAVFVTKCRLMAAVAFIVTAAELNLFFVFSEKKKGLLIFTLVLTALAGAVIALFFDAIKEFVTAFIEKRGAIDDTRSTLWSWCIDRFYSYPAFGYGFYLDEPLLILRLDIVYLVLAHNTVIQWITSTGIVGTCFATAFYCGKYKILLSDFNFKRISVLVFSLIIAANGILDQAALMDIFFLSTSFALIALAEKDNDIKRLYR